MSTPTRVRPRIFGAPRRTINRSAWVSGPGLAFVLPATVVVLLTVVFPLGWSLVTSLHTSRGFARGDFVGLANYADVLTRPGFLEALTNTLGFVAAALTAELVLGFAVALVLNRMLPGTGFFRLLFALPLMIAPVVSGLQWRWLFADQYGLINALLAQVGIKGPLWFGSPTAAKAAVLIADVWLATPFVILVLLAGLSSLPAEIYEAARIDGAGSVRLFFSITLPLLKPVLLMILIVRLADAFRIFDLVYVLTESGPGGATEVLSTYIYKLTFTGLDIGRGSAASFIVMLLVGAISFVVIRALGSRRES